MAPVTPRLRVLSGPLSLVLQLSLHIILSPSLPLQAHWRIGTNPPGPLNPSHPSYSSPFFVVYEDSFIPIP